MGAARWAIPKCSDIDDSSRRVSLNLLPLSGGRPVQSGTPSTRSPFRGGPRVRARRGHRVRLWFALAVLSGHPRHLGHWLVSTVIFALSPTGRGASVVAPQRGMQPTPKSGTRTSAPNEGDLLPAGCVAPPAALLESLTREFWAPGDAPWRRGRRGAPRRSGVGRRSSGGAPAELRRSGELRRISGGAASASGVSSLPPVPTVLEMAAAPPRSQRLLIRAAMLPRLRKWAGLPPGEAERAAPRRRKTAALSSCWPLSTACGLPSARGCGAPTCAGVGF